MLYPEDPHNLERVKNSPDHVFFKKFGEAMPRRDWNHPGTKQGIYMMGPNAEYLEGKFAASSEPEDILARMKRALERWETLKKEKGYANRPVPVVKEMLPPGVEGNLIFRVNLRDLPRADSDTSGRRFKPEDLKAGWLNFVNWAWNENWIGLDDPRAFVPSGSNTEAVPAAVVHKIAREVLVDNVRGQAPHWEAGDVKEAVIQKRRVGTANGVTTIEYTGRVKMEDRTRGYDAKLHGRGEWDEAKSEFRSLNIATVGTRTGAARFNQRGNDRGPAPMGISLSLFKE
jgi:hypothetical protein